MSELRLGRAGWRLSAVVAVVAGLAATAPAQARVTRIVIDSTVEISAHTNYEQITGRAFGELDPANPHNALITDITNPLARDALGKVSYVATFVLRKPKDMSGASGVMWHDVPNRGGDVGFPNDSFAANDVQLLSAWQGDNAGGTSVPADAACPSAGCVGFPHHYVKVPVLTGVTGRLIGRIVNRSGQVSAPLNVMGNPIPYFPADLTHAGDVLRVHTKETVNGVITVGETVPSTDWRYCAATATSNWNTPEPVTALPVGV
jgi:hypothetical protein